MNGIEKKVVKLVVIKKKRQLDQNKVKWENKDKKY